MKAYSNRLHVVVSGGSIHILERRKIDKYGLRKFTRVWRLLERKFKRG